MPEKVSNTKKGRKEDKMNPSDKETIKVAKIIYGSKSLVACMESVIKLHMES